MKQTPLPAPYRWRVCEQSAYLDYNAGNVAHVVREGQGGKFRTVIVFRQHTHQGRCGSVAQGMYFIERWVAARGPALPGGGKVHWYDLPPKLPPDLMAAYWRGREGRMDAKLFNGPASLGEARLGG